MNDSDIYSSQEYKERIAHARRSISALSWHETISTAAESIAYWQMRTVRAEKVLQELGHDEFIPTHVSTRFDI